MRSEVQGINVSKNHLMTTLADLKETSLSEETKSRFYSVKELSFDFVKPISVS